MILLLLALTGAPPEPARVTLNVRDADVREVIARIAQAGKASVILSPKVKGMITLSIRDVSWHAALASVCATLHLVIVREDSGILRIHPGRC